MTDETPQNDKPQRGRPSEFRLEYCDLVRSLRAQGYSISGFCSYVGISRDTFYRWKKEIPEFKEACEIAVEDSISFYEHKGLKGMTGEIKNFNVAAWKELQARQHGALLTNEGKTEINIGNMNVLQQMTDEELQKRLESRMSFLPHKVQSNDGESNQ